MTDFYNNYLQKENERKFGCLQRSASHGAALTIKDQYRYYHGQHNNHYGDAW